MRRNFTAKHAASCTREHLDQLFPHSGELALLSHGWRPSCQQTIGRRKRHRRGHGLQACAEALRGRGVRQGSDSERAAAVQYSSGAISGSDRREPRTRGWNSHTGASTNLRTKRGVWHCTKGRTNEGRRGTECFRESLRVPQAKYSSQLVFIPTLKHWLAISAKKWNRLFD